jgi:hypothetical protein
MMNATHDIGSIRLTSSEIAQLYTTYLNDSLSKCVMLYYANTVEDSDIYAIIKFALSLSEKHLKTIEEIFKTVNHPIPHGFGDPDVNVNAKKIFTDTFMLRYLKQMATLGLGNYSEALNVSAREDVRNFFTHCLQSSIELSNKADDILLSKGLYIRPPYIDIPSKIEFVEKQSYIHGLLGDTRPLNVQEITQIFINLQTNILGKAFTMGLSQTAESERVRNFVLRGKDISQKHVDVFSDMLKKEDLPYPIPYDAEVLNSTEQVFSDKLIVFHVAALNSLGIANYGKSISKSLRADVIASFARLSAEVAQYTKDGMDIMLDNHWLEKFPETADRKALAQV